MCGSPDGSARIAALSADQCSPSTAITRCPTMRAKRPDRQAALGAGLPVGAGATTVNKMCGSGMKAVMLAHDQILAGSADVIVAGGMESMSNAPYLLERARSGYRMGHGQVVDHMFFDGLEDAYDKGRLMGTFAEQCATSYQFTREAQDAFAATSLTRAKKAIADGTFEPEIVPVPVPVPVPSGKSAKMVASDEQPPKLQIDRLPRLKPAFRDSGTVTAGNSSSISDGAAALALMRRSEAEDAASSRARLSLGTPRLCSPPTSLRPPRSEQSACCLTTSAGLSMRSSSSKLTRRSPS